MNPRLDDPDFEPSDAQLCDVAVRAFARIQDVHEQEIEHVRHDIEATRAEVLRALAGRAAR